MSKLLSADQQYECCKRILSGKEQFLKKPFRWGFMAAGQIANDFALALKAIPNCELQAITSRTKESASDLAKKLGFKKVYDRPEELVMDKEIDCVYISPPHNKHFELAKLCLKNKIPVLCEKPMTMNASEAKELLELSKSTGTFLMEAMWTRFIPALLKAKELVKEIGPISYLTCDISYDCHSSEKLEKRATDKEMAGGASLDVGVYGVALASWMLGGEPPLAVRSLCTKTDTGVDQCTTIALQYGDKLASITCSIFPKGQGSAWINGEKGSIHLHGPGWQHGLYVTLHKGWEDRQDFKYDLPNVKGDFCFERGQLMVHEAMEVMKCILEGKRESPQMPIQESVNIMITLDRVRKELGLLYEKDEHPSELAKGRSQIGGGMEHQQKDSDMWKKKQEEKEMDREQERGGNKMSQMSSTGMEGADSQKQKSAKLRQQQ